MKTYRSVLFTILALLFVALAIPLMAVEQDDMMGEHSDIMRFADGSVVEDFRHPISPNIGSLFGPGT